MIQYKEKMRNSTICSYLITCERTSKRIPDAIDLLNTIEGMDLQIIRKFDVGNFINRGYEPKLWKEHINNIKEIMKSNIIRAGASNEEDKINQMLHSTIKERQLRPSEQSLLIKIAWSLSQFATKDHEYVLICEDDLRNHPSTSLKNAKMYLKNIINEFIDAKGDFLDIGSLPILDLKQNEIANKTHSYMTTIRQPMTRSTCCFIMSRKLSISVAKLLFPYSLPIDLHLQYIFNKLAKISPAKAYWGLPNYLCNASMIGSLSSSIQ